MPKLRAIPDPEQIAVWINVDTIKRVTAVSGKLLIFYVSDDARPHEIEDTPLNRAALGIA